MEETDLLHAVSSAILVRDIFDRHNEASPEISLAKYRCEHCNKTIPLGKLAFFVNNFKRNIEMPFCDKVCVDLHFKNEMAILGFSTEIYISKTSREPWEIPHAELIQLYTSRLVLSTSTSPP